MVLRISGHIFRCLKTLRKESRRRCISVAERYDFTHAERKEKIIKICISIGIWIVSVAAVIALAWLIVWVSIEKTTVVDASMEPTLHQDDKIVIDKLTYRIREPKRNEIVVFRQGDNEHSFYNIKRIIGLPGERIRISDGVVLINDEPLQEFANVEPMLLPGLANYEITLGEDEYFVLGDSRNNSEDSRYATVSNVKRDEIIGRAWIRTNKFGFVNSLNKRVEEESK
ncbi:MAG: signal peptidase I [Lachnospiraceae bacterium]|nr:signal peptidase I [Lachnospiraceae bacterium]